MAPETARKPPQRENHTIILPIGQAEYEQIVSDFTPFRIWLDEQFHLHPKLFPKTFGRLFDASPERVFGSVLKLLTKGQKCLFWWVSTTISINFGHYPKNRSIVDNSR